MKKSYLKSFYIDGNSFEESELFLMAPYENKEKAWVVSNAYPLPGEYQVVYSEDRPKGYTFAGRFPKLDNVKGDPDKIKETMIHHYGWWYADGDNR